VDLPLYDGDFGSIEPESLVFPGALTYKANLWAVEFFLAQVFPAVKAQRPGVKLYITGRTDGVPVDDLPLQDGVIFTGYLDDVRPRVACSPVCVVPMTVGGGTRLKILEAMALGTPVVSTSKGAEGLDVVHGQDILIADDAGDFARAVLSLLQDRDLRTKLAINGRRLVEERHSWQIGARQLEQLLYRVTGHETQSDS
jgi:glycosyltransferase involved in cell wall biosynthesis